MGFQSMASAAALSFECCQRVWDAFGYEDAEGQEHHGIEWGGYEPGKQIALVQSKTGNSVALPLTIEVSGEIVRLYPDLEDELARTPPSSNATVFCAGEWWTHLGSNQGPAD